MHQTVPWEKGCSLSTLLLLLYSTLLLTCPWALRAEREVGKGAMAGALLPEHLLEGHWDSGLSPRHRLDAAPQAEAAVSRQQVSLFAVVAQRKLYSQLISTHETFVGVLLARGIPNRVVLPRAGQSSTSFKLGAILTAVILQKEGSD